MIHRTLDFTQSRRSLQNSSHHCCIPYPPGASKWNLIDHRMFSLISENWAGEPLESYAVMLKWIQKTRSETGFTCRACLDRGCYPTGGKITEEEKATIHLKPRKVLPKWNYTIWPHKPAPKYWPDQDKC